MSATGEPIAAERAYRAAIKHDGQAVDARANLAELLRMERRGDDALEMLRAALTIAPTRIDLWRRLATLDRREGKLEDAVARLTQLPGTSLGGGGDHRVLYELGQLQDRLGNADAAYPAFAEANRLMGARAAQVDARRYIAGIEAHIEKFSADWVATWPVAKAEDPERPVFLVGFPRSGTTLMDQILDSHPQVKVLEEEPLISTIVGELGHRHSDYLGAIASMGADEVAEWRERYLTDLRAALFVQSDDSHVLVDKMPLNIVYLGLIAQLFPKARIILALRHPCDVVLSNFMQAFELNDAMANFLTLESSGRLYDRVMALWRQYVDVLELQPHVLRYEDLVEDVEGESWKVLEYLNVSWNDAVLTHTDHARERTISTPSFRQVTEPIYTRLRYRWRRYEHYVSPVLPLLASHIAAFGYGTFDQ